MKEIYLDIMEKALSAYTDERIGDYIVEVERDGLSEHGFPRLASDIGILIAYDRRKELLPVFIRMMDICCEQMPKRDAANDFSIREVCCCLKLLEEKGKVEQGLIAKWKAELYDFDPWKFYTEIAPSPETPVANWAAFAAVSEFVRGKYCGIDTSKFVDWQVSSQLLSFEENGMYKDPNNPTVYDLVARMLLSSLLHFGYNGKFAGKIEEQLDKASNVTLKMQSVTGELAFGGRSNQFFHNEPMISSYCEMEAVRYARKSDLKKAGEFKAAAELAARFTLNNLNEKCPHHIKNKYNVDSGIGCEDYAYFNKYMITVASNIYMAYLFSDDTIVPTVAPSQKGGYVLSTSKDFHKTFLNSGGYFLEFDTEADFHYDANGLGRVHKQSSPSTICLSVPFSPNPNYGIDGKNPGAMSICCFAETDGKCLIGAESYAEYTLVCCKATSDSVKTVFDCKLSDDITVNQEYTVSENGVDIVLSGVDKIGFMLPVFDFDGEKNTKITVSDTVISTEYNSSVCTYSFNGEISSDFKYYYNRNGRYRVYSVKSKCMHIEITDIQKNNNVIE